MKPKSVMQAARSSGLERLLPIAAWTAIGLLALFFIVPVLLRFSLHDPLPGQIRAQFDRMDAVGKEIKSLVARAKGFNDASALTEVKNDYETLESKFNEAVQQAKNGIQLNAVDKNFLSSALAEIEPRQVALRNRLSLIAKPVIEAGFGPNLDFLLQLLKGAAQEWEELFRSRAKIDRIAIEQLDQMKWPDWDQIQKSSGL